MSSTSSSSSTVNVITHHTLQCAHHLPTPPTSTIHPLGPLDHLAASYIPIANVYVYGHGVDTDRLQRACQLLLDYYPHLTGRLQVDPHTGTYTIHSLHTGALLVLAQCTQGLDELVPADGRLTVNDLPAAGNSLLTPYDPAAYATHPLFSIQHTAFPYGTTALSIRLYHATCDAQGFFLLVGHLAELYRGLQSSPTPTLTHPPHIQSYMADAMTTTDAQATAAAALQYQPALLHVTPSVATADAHVTLPDADNAQTAPSTTTSTPQPPATTGRILHFAAQQLQELKAHASDPASSGDSWITTFEAIYALLCQCIYQARKKVITDLSPPDILTPFNYRGGKRLAELPAATYFPNALLCLYSTLSPDMLATAPLHHIAKHIHTMIAGAPSTHDIKQTLQWIGAQPDKSKIETGFRYGSGSLMVSAWQKFDIYTSAVLHDDVKPVLVSTPFTSISLIDGLAYTMPTPEADGSVDVNLALTEPVWQILEQDETFTKYTSKWSTPWSG